MKSKMIIAMTAFTAVLLAGCQAPRGLQHEVSAPQVIVDEQQSEELQQFAQTLVKQLSGNAVVQEVTPFGPAQISKDREYVNGLGEQCYRFSITTESDRHYAAVCRGKDQQWRYVELVH